MNGSFFSSGHKDGSDRCSGHVGCHSESSDTGGGGCLMLKARYKLSAINEVNDCKLKALTMKVGCKLTTSVNSQFHLTLNEAF